MNRTLILAAMLSVSLAACSDDRKSTDATAPAAATMGSEQTNTEEAKATHQMTPEQLGELGAQIEREPGKANDLLKEHGLDEKSFERQIRQVTEDPDASKRYADAYRRAKA